MKDMRLPANCQMLLGLLVMAGTWIDPCFSEKDRVLAFPAQSSKSNTFLEQINPYPDTNLKDLTVCVKVLLYYRYNDGENIILSSEWSDENWLGLVIAEKSDYGFIYVADVGYTFAFPQPLEPGVWNSFCVLYDNSTQRIAVYMNNAAVLDVTDFKNQNNRTFPERTISRLRIGSSKELFAGKITDFNIWSKVLPLSDILKVQKCKNASSSPDLLNWETAMWSLTDEMSMEVLDMNVCDANKNSPKIHINPSLLPFVEANKLCTNLGGSMITPTNQAEAKSFAAMIMKEEECKGKMWIPIRQNVTTNQWFDIISKKSPNFQPWYPGTPDGGRLQNCVILEERGLWDDKFCQDKYCHLCKVNTGVHFELNGLCKDSKIDQNYILKTDSKSGDFFWEGYGKTKIIFNPTKKTWEIRGMSKKKGETTLYAELKLNSQTLRYPLGLFSWTLLKDACLNQPESRQVQLKLSSCNNDQFSCSDSTCIPLKNRCDMVVECEDFSDEDDCSFINLEPNYNADIPSLKPDFKEQMLTVNVQINRILELKDVEMNMLIDFFLEIEWIDAGLTFVNLNENMELNLISQKNVHKMWIPKLVFDNDDEVNPLPLDDNVAIFVKKMDNGTYGVLPNQYNEAIYHEGTKNPLKYQRKFLTPFECEFFYGWYPFDTQKCNIIISNFHALKHVVNLKPGALQFLGSPTLMQHQVRNFTFIQHDKNTIRVEITFQRMFFQHLCTTFLPSFCVLTIALCTVHFKAEHFKTSVPVAITSMLVMYTLHLAVSRSLPPTAYIKLIDVWILFHLIIPFLIFLLLFAVEHCETKSPIVMPHLSVITHLPGIPKSSSNKPQPPASRPPPGPMPMLEGTRLPGCKSVTKIPAARQQQQKKEESVPAPKKCANFNKNMYIFLGRVVLPLIVIIFVLIFWIVSISHYY